jgi:cobyrinic acid a,c-diamide synthase
VVVDEAFMDAMPGQVESMIGGPMPGLIVLRSLTKTWGLAGLRAGYAVGDERLIARLRVQQPPWSVSTPALAAVVACVSPEALQMADRAAAEIGRQRAYLLDRLLDIGLPAAGNPQAPFVLVDTTPVRGSHPAGWLRVALRDHGFAVRRGETFPGLDADWIRIAVRDEQTTDRLWASLRRLVRL